MHPKEFCPHRLRLLFHDDLTWQRIDIHAS
jgi:hypothetical protein